MIQIINKRRPSNAIGDAITSLVSGFQSGQDRRRAQEEASLAQMKTMAEMEKLNAEIPLLQAQSNLFNSYAGSFGGQDQEPTQPDTTEDDAISQKITELESELQQASSQKTVPNNVKRGRILSQDEDVLGLGF